MDKFYRTVAGSSNRRETKGERVEPEIAVNLVSMPAAERRGAHEELRVQWIYLQSKELMCHRTARFEPSAA